jgi:hypothetical protein
MLKEFMYSLMDLDSTMYLFVAGYTHLAMAEIGIPSFVKHDTSYAFQTSYPTKGGLSSDMFKCFLLFCLGSRTNSEGS